MTGNNDRALALVEIGDLDAINGERAQGTLPRLLSQPIHRDDVINGKFVAGLALIGLSVNAVMLVVAGIGLVRLGIKKNNGNGDEQTPIVVLKWKEIYERLEMAVDKVEDVTNVLEAVQLKYA